MNKRILSIFIIMVFCFTTLLPNVTQASEPIKVFYNGDQIKFLVDPINDKGTTIVAFRPIFERLGLKITWDDKTKTIKGTKDGLIIELQIGNIKAKVNGLVKPLSIAPKIVKGSTMVPLRFVGEATGNSVLWDEKNNRINISSVISVIDSKNSNGSSYTGEFNNGKPNGKGILTTVEGNKLDGIFKDGLLNGYGTYTGIDGSIYVGDWINGNRDGSGKYTRPSKFSYDGTWKNDKMDGYGVALYSKGEKYEGYWANANWDGQGKLTFEDGSYYDGEFKDGKYNGYGTEYDSIKDITRQGTYANDSYISSEFKSSGAIKNNQSGTPTKNNATKDIGKGKLKGLVSWQYNKLIGTKPDVGAKIYLIPSSFDLNLITDLEADHLAAIGMVDSEKTGIYFVKANGYGNYELNNVAAGKYIEIIVSANTKQYEDPDEYTTFILKPIIKNWDNFVLFNLSLNKYEIKMITINANETVDASFDFGNIEG